MDIEITEKINNPFFKRTEIHFVVKHQNQGTPNKAILRNELANALNAKKDQIIIDSIHSGYGIQQIKGYAKVYNSQKEAEKIERKHILKKNQVTSTKTKQKEDEKTSEPSLKEEPIAKEEPKEKKENTEKDKEET